MKFGDFLEDNLVSEWRSQYLDYSRGKNKLKKLTRFLETSSARISSKVGETDDVYRGSPLVSDRKGDDFCSVKNRLYNGTNGNIKENGKINENSPLLSNNNELVYTNDETTPKSSHHRSHSTSVLYVRRRFASLSDHSNTTPNLNPNPNEIITLAKNEYIRWVDLELTKVNAFYETKEIECVKRFLVLMDQLNKLKHFDSNLEHQTRKPTEFESRNSIVGRRDHNIKIRISSIFSRLHNIFHYFELPSLPNYFWNRSEDSNSLNLLQDDVNILDDIPPPFKAKIMIKKAFCELYHTMEFLSSFRVINRIAFQKLIKKYDKCCHDSKLPIYIAKVDAMYFNTSEILGNLTQSVEDCFTDTFENGHRKTAIMKLRTLEAIKTYYYANFFSGYMLGISCPFLLVFALNIYTNINSNDFPNLKYVAQLWGSIFLFVFAGLLFSLNCFIWDKYKINYKLVFEFNPQDALDYRQFLIIPSILLFCGSILSFFGFSSPVSEQNLPYVYLYVILAFLLNPFNIFYFKARMWFLVSTVRLILSGFYPVEFRDFFMGVTSCSLTYSISNIYLFFCLKSINWQSCNVCGPMKSYMLGYFSCIPPLWRSLQCLRRFLDTGEWFPHFANLAKYLITTMYFCSLSIYRISSFRDLEYQNFNSSRITIFFIFISSINSIYSSFWDICMDWSLLQKSSENFLLRDILIYKYKSFYYFAIIFDIILRFQWILYVFTPYKISHSALTAFGVAVAEIVRRFVWMFFRMENEHATNVDLFRVSRVCLLPYSYNVPSILESEILKKFAKVNLKLDLHSVFQPDIQIEMPILASPNVFDENLSIDLEGISLPFDSNNISLHGSDIVSIYSNLTQYTVRDSKQSGWGHVSKIISRAHTKEFQKNETKRNDQNLPKSGADIAFCANDIHDLDADDL